MSKEWRAYNQSITDNLEDEKEEEYTMNQIGFNDLVNYSGEEHVQRGGSRPCKKLNKDRIALYYVELLYNDYF